VIRIARFDGIRPPPTTSVKAAPSGRKIYFCQICT
jgi:hypothetical protein